MLLQTLTQIRMCMMCLCSISMRHRVRLLLRQQVCATPIAFQQDCQTFPQTRNFLTCRCATSATAFCIDAGCAGSCDSGGSFESNLPKSCQANGSICSFGGSCSCGAHCGQCYCTERCCSHTGWAQTDCCYHFPTLR